MADVAPVQVTRDAPVAGVGERMIAIEKIRPNVDQPRRDFDPDQLEDLANSIREKGVIQPLILRDMPNQPGMYEIVAGERRWRASQMAQLHEVPALIRDYNETEVLEIAIIENIQRADLNAVEEAAGYRQLMDRFGHTQEKIAEALGKSRSHIANLLRLLNLPDGIQDMVRKGQLSAGHARALVTAENPLELAKHIASKGLSVRDAERLAKGSANKPAASTPRPSEKDADTLALEGDMSAALALKVQIDHGSDLQSGKMTISYKTLEDLDRLCGLLSGQSDN
jgi:ParB family chromosome partitioning protein